MNKKKKPKDSNKSILNRRARFDYELQDELKVGIVLTGPEVRAARDGHIQLKGSFVIIRNNELWLNNASFSVKLQQRGESHARSVDTRSRKLLATKKQIDSLINKKRSGMSIVPTKFLNQGKHMKVVIALGKGKKHRDKRETIKRRDQNRDTKRLLKQYR